MNRFILLLLLFGITHCKSSSDNKKHVKVSSSFYSIKLNTIDGESVTLSKIRESKATVFFFMSPECPICQNYSSTINEILNEYYEQNIGFFCIFPGTYYSKNQIQKYLSDYRIQFYALLDPQFILSKNIDAKVMPEAFVIDSSGTILYHGCIDNWYYSIGKQRSVVTEHYVKNVLENVVNNKPVDVKNTEAIGCFIE